MAEKILFFFSALGVFNACLLTLYLTFLKAKRQIEDYFLGALFFCLVIRVGVSCFHFFGTVPREVIKLGLAANLLLGPLILFLVRALLNSSKHLIAQTVWHLGICLMGLLFAWFLFDFSTWNWQIRYVIHFGLTVYLLTVAIIWRKELAGFLISKSNYAHSREAMMIYLALVIVCLGFSVSLITSYILGPLTFSVIFYLTAGYLLLNSKRERKRQHKKLDRSAFDALHQKLTNLMESEKLYRNADLSLDSLAKQLSTNKHMLSHVLNEGLKKNFHQYVNEFRVQEACHLLKQNNHFSVEAIAHEVGFHSRSSFFASFKRQMGVTPSKFREVR